MLVVMFGGGGCWSAAVRTRGGCNLDALHSDETVAWEKGRDSWLMYLVPVEDISDVVPNGGPAHATRLPNNCSRLPTSGHVSRFLPVRPILPPFVILYRAAGNAYRGGCCRVSGGVRVRLPCGQIPRSHAPFKSARLWRAPCGKRRGVQTAPSGRIFQILNRGV